LYDETVRKLSTEDAWEAALRLFELTFLEEIGYAPTLDNDIRNGSPVHPDKFYVYLTEQGPVECGPRSDSIRGSTLLGLKNRTFSTSSELSEAKSLMRQLIAHHLGGRSLRSRELFRYLPQP
jgi:DNA repair protein RecO (recombination protein O)